MWLGQIQWYWTPSYLFGPCFLYSLALQLFDCAVWCWSVLGICSLTYLIALCLFTVLHISSLNSACRPLQSILPSCTPLFLLLCLPWIFSHPLASYIIPSSSLQPPKQAADGIHTLLVLHTIPFIHHLFQKPFLMILSRVGPLSL